MEFVHFGYIFKQQFPVTVLRDVFNCFLKLFSGLMKSCF